MSINNNFSLNDELNSIAAQDVINKIEIPSYILDGINERFKLRDYQEQAIKRFIYYMQNKEKYQEHIMLKNKDFLDARENKNHLLFNIATGGGKTLLMACVMLYLNREYGYNNFLFLSHLNSISIKTRDNFFNKNSSKYLFNKNISIQNVCDFDFSNNNRKSEINLMIDTYQSINLLINIVKENSFNLEDIKDKKIVIIADEGHHLNAQVSTGQKKGEDGASWERSVEQILNTNMDNFLLEWTATISWNKPEFKSKYNPICIYRYDLKNFYEEKWTKNILLLNRNVEIENLMFGAIILNKYRQVLFGDIGKKIKPVILFKSEFKRTSLDNHNKFNQLIDGLDNNYIDNFEATLDDGMIVKTALNYLRDKFKNNLVRILKVDFNEKFIINTNEDEQLESNAILLNTLEEEQNVIRIIFTVDKLNEGWDVLNLFDIVKLYETNKTNDTVQEAQLIGRGARLYPFEYDGNLDNKYKRKFDDESNNVLSILELLYFHSRQDSASISKLKKELENSGIILGERNKIEIKIKKDVMAKIKDKLVFCNKKIPKINNSSYDIYKDMKIFSNNFTYKLYSNNEDTIRLMGNNKNNMNKSINYDTDNDDRSKLIKLKDFNYYIKKSAIIDNINYNFEQLYKKLNFNSYDEFITKLDEFDIYVKSWEDTIVNQYLVYTKFLNALYENIISKKFKEYNGTKEFTYKQVNKVFKDKMLFRESIDGEQKNEFKADKYNYYLYHNSQLTTEEQGFVKFFDEKIYNELQEYFDEIYLIRNERDLKLYNFDNADGFEPDFILLLKDRFYEYNIFIEPKGGHLLRNDEWKNDFLSEITKLTKNNELNIVKDDDDFKYSEPSVINDNMNYKILGFKFYNNEHERAEHGMENEFKDLIEMSKSNK